MKQIAIGLALSLAFVNSAQAGNHMPGKVAANSDSNAVILTGMNPSYRKIRCTIKPSRAEFQEDQYETI